MTRAVEPKSANPALGQLVRPHADIGGKIWKKSRSRRGSHGAAAKHGFKEIEAAITNKLRRGTFNATGSWPIGTQRISLDEI
jgi:hypothetical protein